MAIGIEKLSARNQLKGTVTAIEKGTVSAKVKIDMGGGVFVTSSITTKSVDEPRSCHRGRGCGDHQVVGRDDRQVIGTSGVSGHYYRTRRLFEQSGSNQIIKPVHHPDWLANWAAARHFFR